MLNNVSKGVRLKQDCISIHRIVNIYTPKKCILETLSLEFSFNKKHDLVKANGQFWYMAKMKIYIFALLMQHFIELYELLMPC